MDNFNNYFSSDKKFDELTEEEEKERIKDVALSEGCSEDDASYMAHMWQNF